MIKKYKDCYWIEYVRIVTRKNYKNLNINKIQKDTIYALFLLIQISDW